MAAVICRICNRPVSGEGTLSDGSAYHHKCYEDLVDRQAHFQKLSTEDRARNPEVAAEEARLQEICGALIRERSLAARIRRAFTKLPSRETEIEAEANAQARRMVEVSSAVDRQMAYIRDELSRAGERLAAIHDVWTTYPPDWDMRRAGAIAAQAQCEDCRSRSGLHVHHRRPVGQGGTHKPANLVVLCRRCHAKHHGGANLGARAVAVSPRHTKKIQTLQLAIDEGRRVSFHYEKYGGERTSRSMLPKCFETVGDYDSLCVRGHCFLRNEERIFAVRRMSRLKVIEAGRNQE